MKYERLVEILKALRSGGDSLTVYGRRLRPQGGPVLADLLEGELPLYLSDRYETTESVLRNVLEGVPASFVGRVVLNSTLH